jgi:hypothetical protein
MDRGRRVQGGKDAFADVHIVVCIQYFAYEHVHIAGICMRSKMCLVLICTPA